MTLTKSVLAFSMLLLLVACGDGGPTSTALSARSEAPATTLATGVDAAASTPTPETSPAAATPTTTTMPEWKVPNTAPVDPSLLQPPWNDAARAADELGSMTPAGYGGVSNNNADQKVDIYVVKGYNQLADALLKVAAPYGRIIYVERSQEVLGAIARSIQDNYAWLQSIGLSPTLIGPEVKTNSVVIHVPAFTPEQERAVKDRFSQYVELQVVDEHFLPGNLIR